MKIEWTSTTPSVAKVTLGDDSVKHTVELQSLGGQSVEQVEQLVRSATVSRFARGNIAGEFAFIAAKSHATRSAAVTYAVAEYGRLNQLGTLELTEGATKITAAGAVLTAVSVAQIVGLRWFISYRFGIQTLTS